MTPSLLRRCEALHELARAASGRRFLGRRVDRSALAGTEVTDQVDYTPGADPRDMDWNRCARMDELVTNLRHGREDHHVLLLVDCSGSMNPAGSGKFAYARELATQLAYLALAGGNTLSAAGYTDRIIASLPPLRGRPELPRLVKFLEGLTPSRSATNLLATIRDWKPSPLARPRQVLVISDFLEEEGWDKGIEALRRRGYELHLVQLYDRRDADPELRGGVKLVDLESDAVLSEELDADDLARYREVFAEFRGGLASYCRKYGVKLTQVCTDVPSGRCVEEMVLSG